MKMFRYSLIGILGILLFSSCYRDKGNYSYKDLNEISIDVPEVVSVQQGMVLEISPKFNFALEAVSYTHLICSIVCCDGSTRISGRSRGGRIVRQSTSKSCPRFCCRGRRRRPWQNITIHFFLNIRTGRLFVARRWRIWRR